MGSVNQLADINGGPLPCEPSLFHLLKRRVETQPDSPAIKVTYQPSEHLVSLKAPRDLSFNANNTDFCSWTYADVHSAALKLVKGLTNAGVRSQASLVTLVPNGLEWALLHWTSMLGKYAYSSVDLGALQPARVHELESLLTDTQADVIFVPDAAGAAAVDGVLPNLRQHPVLKIVLNQHDVPLGWTSFLSLGSQEVDDHTRRQIEEDALRDDPDRLWGILFTSGTTSGKPKGCPKSVRSLLHSTKSQYWGDSFGPGYSSGLTTANFRAIAPFFAVSTFQSGGCLVMPNLGWSACDLLRWNAVLPINTVVLVPFMIHSLVADPAFSNADKSGLKTLFIGGDMVTRDLFLKAAQAFPEAHIMVGHGMTEGGGTVIWPLSIRDSISKIPWHADIAPIGKVQRGAHYKIVDDNNKIMLRNQLGELHVCSEAYIKRYTGNAKPEDFYTDEGGSWFNTGDVGMLNDDGWVYILGRKKDIIKRAGVGITPAAIESALDGYLKTQTSVIGVPHETLGQEPFAVVKDLNGRSKEQVIDFVFVTFGKDSPLRGIATLSDLGFSHWPLGSTGKILKRELILAVASYTEH